jgi:flagellar hook assembly protein FlgD
MAFSLPQPGRVTLKLYDVAGRLVRTLEDGELPAGTHARLWDRKNDHGTEVRSGVYFARLQVADRAFGQKLVLVH